MNQGNRTISHLDLNFFKKKRRRYDYFLKTKHNVFTFVWLCRVFYKLLSGCHGGTFIWWDSSDIGVYLLLLSPAIQLLSWLTLPSTNARSKDNPCQHIKEISIFQPWQVQTCPDRLLGMRTSPWVYKLRSAGDKPYRMEAAVLAGQA